MQMNTNTSEVMKDFPGIKFIMLGDGQIEYILRNLESILSVPGDVVELGCNVGMTTSFMRRLLNVAKSDKEIHVYESCKGLPAKTELDGVNHTAAGDSTVTKEAFHVTFSKAGLKLPVINAGWFAEIPDTNYPAQICFAFFDGDYYSSIMDSFKKVYDKMQPGGIILVHDYEWLPYPGVKKACDDFLKDKPEKVTNEIFGIGKMVKQ
jgi:O-methyltransferase